MKLANEMDDSSAPKKLKFCINSLLNDKFLDWSKLKAIADDKINLNKKIKTCFQKGRKHCGISKKCWLTAFSPIPTMFSKDFSIEVMKKSGLCGTELSRSMDVQLNGEMLPQ